MTGILGIYETVLYARDLPAAAAFYRETVGLREIERPNEHSLAFRLEDGGLLLVFDPDQSSGPGRFVPAHGADGAGHMAFRVGQGTLEPLVERFRGAGVEIEREITWPLGGRSFYVRDPAGNSIEFVEGEIWDG